MVECRGWCCCWCVSPLLYCKRRKSHAIILCVAVCPCHLQKHRTRFLHTSYLPPPSVTLGVSAQTGPSFDHGLHASTGYLWPGINQLAHTKLTSSSIAEHWFGSDLCSPLDRYCLHLGSFCSLRLRWKSEPLLASTGWTTNHRSKGVRNV